MTASQTDSKSVQALMEQFDAIEAYLQAVREVLEEGHMPDIADLHNRISRLCLDAARSPPDFRKTCLERLDSLLKKLDTCEREMTSFQQVLSESLQ